MLPVTGIRKTTFLKPVLPLVPEVIPKSDDNQRSIITMELKSEQGLQQAPITRRRLLFLMREPLKNGLIPRGISLKSGDRIALLFQQIECLSLKLCSEERP